jgi:hypothetical protein
LDIIPNQGSPACCESTEATQTKNWAKAAQAELQKRLGYAHDGAARFQDGGWNNPYLWQQQPNPAFGWFSETSSTAATGLPGLPIQHIPLVEKSRSE